MNLERWCWRRERVDLTFSAHIPMQIEDLDELADVLEGWDMKRLAQSSPLAVESLIAFRCEAAGEGPCAVWGVLGETERVPSLNRAVDAKLEVAKVNLKSISYNY
jgi:hypothetical protein